MGNSCLKAQVEPFSDQGWDTWKDLVETFGFTSEEFHVLYRPFSSLKMESCNKVPIFVLADYYGFASDEHLLRCFGLLDKRQSGLLDFGEFFLALWNYCTHSVETHLLFSFLACDKSHIGALGEFEVRACLRDAYYSAEHTEEEHWVSVEELIVSESGSFTYTDFASLISTHYELFAWAFRLRPSFIEQFWDSEFWAMKGKANIVMMIDNGHEVPLSSNTVLQFKAKGLRNFELLLDWARGRAIKRVAQSSDSKNGYRSIRGQPSKIYSESNTNNSSSFLYSTTDYFGPPSRIGSATLMPSSRRPSGGALPAVLEAVHDEIEGLDASSTPSPGRSSNGSNASINLNRGLHTVNEETSILLHAEHN